MIIRLLAAMLLGAIIGVQREKTGKPAGLRTHMLTAMGSTLFVLGGAAAGMSMSDLSRVIQGLAADIGFIGAGAILKLREQREIEGLTTAAGIWMTAAAGVAVGLGQIGLAFLSVILTWIVLSVLGRNRASPRGLRSRDENLDPSADVAVASRVAEDERSTFRELADGGVRSANRSPHAAQAEDHLKALFHRHGEWDRR